MVVLITVVHVLAAIFLIVVVLLQRGRGAEMGAVFGGGGGGTMFGSRGAGNFLTKLTTGSAIVFMLTSLSLSYLGMTGGSERLFEDGSAQEPPAKEAPLFQDVGKKQPGTAGEAAGAESGKAPAAGQAQAPAPAPAPPAPAAP